MKITNKKNNWTGLSYCSTVPTSSLPVKLGILNIQKFDKYSTAVETWKILLNWLNSFDRARIFKQKMMTRNEEFII